MCQRQALQPICEEFNADFDRERRRVNRNLRRALKAGTAATLTLEQWVETIAHFRGLCAYCQKKPFAVLEHFIPVELGGTVIGNVVPACQACNVFKDCLPPTLEAWVRVREYLIGQGADLVLLEQWDDERHISTEVAMCPACGRIFFSGYDETYCSYPCKAEDKLKRRK
jgi:hypothetical protein